MKNEYHVTWKLYKSWIWERALKGANLALMIFWAALGIFALAMAVLADIMQIFYLIMAVFCFYRAFLRNILLAKKQYAKLAATYGEENWLRSIFFEDLEIRLKEGSVDMHFAYNDIMEMLEKEKEIRLVFRNKSVIRLYRDSFVDTDWEACRALIEEKRKGIG